MVTPVTPAGRGTPTLPLRYPLTTAQVHDAWQQGASVWFVEWAAPVVGGSFVGAFAIVNR
jgi:hypothetical protein